MPEKKATECGVEGCNELAAYRARFESKRWSEYPVFCLRFCEAHKGSHAEFKKIHGDDLGPLEIIGDRERKILEAFEEMRKMME